MGKMSEIMCYVRLTLSLSSWALVLVSSPPVTTLLLSFPFVSVTSELFKIPNFSLTCPSFELVDCIFSEQSFPPEKRGTKNVLPLFVLVKDVELCTPVTITICLTE